MGLRHRRMLSADRSLPCDVVHFSGKVPIARAEMCCELGSLQRQRAMVQPRMSWASLFLRAYGIVCNRHEFLRTSYMPWPFPHLYLHPHTVAMVAMHREYRERPRLCWARIVDPAGRSLREIQAKLDHYASQAPEDAFRKQFRLSRFPIWLRRLAWYVTLYGSGRVRAKQVGTFSMSTLSGQGVINRDHPTLCTTSLTYGPIDTQGRCLVTLVYDHRVFDGMQAATALRDLQDCLADEVQGELAAGQRSAA